MRQAFLQFGNRCDHPCKRLGSMTFFRKFVFCKVHVVLYVFSKYDKMLQQ